MSSSKQFSRIVVVALGLCLLGTGCAGLPVSLRKLLDNGSLDRVVSKGQSWLDKQQARGKHPPERDEVFVLVGEARLGLARRADTVEAYREFARRYAREPIVADLVHRSRGFEATAFFRDQTQPLDTLEGYQEFQSRYPGVPEAEIAGRREAEIALRRALDQDSLDAVRAFLRTYGARPEAAASVAQARQHEVLKALAEAQSASSLAGWREFRLTYESWPEAAEMLSGVRVNELSVARDLAIRTDTVAAYQELMEAYGEWPEMAPFEPELYDREARRAFQDAHASHELNQLSAGLERYTRGQWPERFERAIADYHLRALRQALEAGQPLDDEQTDTLLQVMESVPRISEQAERLRAKLAKAASRHKSGPMSLLYARLFPDDREAERFQKRAVTFYWQEAELADQPAKWLRFVRWFPEARESREAEERFLAFVELQRKDAFGMRAAITRTIRQANGDLDLYIEVRDAAGARVSGLTRDAFRVFFGSRKVEILQFWGFEEERPLDIVFAIDMSGSMSTEREAVRMAVAHFASTLNYRGRSARLGLLTFTEQVMDVHRPSSKSDQFIRWMQQLSSATGGGDGEDGVAALLEAGTMLQGAKGERVVVLMTDEPLQINTAGHDRLRTHSNSPCNKGKEILQCRRNCRALASGEAANCEAGCIRKLGGDAPSLLSKCAQKFGLPRCVQDSYWDNALRTMLHTCGEPVIRANDPETVKLIRELETRQIRPFLLVTPDANPGDSAFRQLASELQGQVIHVPDDTTSPQPYVDALQEIAERLSRQYVVRVRPPRNAGEVQVAVRPIHRWNEFGASPDVDFLDMWGLGGTPECPSLVVAASDGLLRSDACGAKWLPLAVEIATPFREVRPLGNRSLIVGSDHLLWLLDAEGRPSQVTTDLSELLHVAWLARSAFLVLGRDAAGALVLEQWRLDGAPERIRRMVVPALSVSPPAGAIPVVFWRGQEANPRAFCVLSSHDRMNCTTDGGENWVERAVRGLAEPCLKGVASQMMLPVHQPIWLLAGADGSLYRSIGDSGNWTRVLAPGSGVRRLVRLGTSPEVVCAVSHREVQCSENGGFEFFPVGLGYEQNASSGLAVVDGQLILASGGRIHRLMRVLTRELPSSSVYFETNDHNPSPAMMPFLREIALAMQQYPKAFLRVEGHADKRGSDELNDALAARRAESVAQIFSDDMGVPAERMFVLSFGKRQPVQAGDSPRAHARNRRVELLMMETPPRGWFGTGND
ncbi:MAG TPA: OmpA family protein [Myxococcota bacterium]|nr:OmpA family protein [Myxococcota bacterium]